MIIINTQWDTEIINFAFWCQDIYYCDFTGINFSTPFSRGYIPRIFTLVPWRLKPVFVQISTAIMVTVVWEKPGRF